MHKLFLLIILLPITLFTQSFNIEKVTGKVFVQKGMEEKWIAVKNGDKVSDDDLISTGNNSSVRFSRNGNSFLLKSNSALNISGIKSLSINDLLLALTREEINSIPRQKNNPDIKTTAVYGTENNGRNDIPVIQSDLGKRKINGALQLAEAGFKESSVLVAMETFRKYPETQLIISNRIYFADLLEKLTLYEEAYKEYEKILSMNLNPKDQQRVKNKLEELSKKIS
jgi:hypothetical protein